MKQRKSKKPVKRKGRTLLDQQPKTVKRKIFELIGSDDFLSQWRISFSDKRLESDNHWAETEIERRLVTISPQNTLFELIDTFIHEVLHVMLGRRMHERLSYAVADKKIETMTEQVIEVLSPLEIQHLLATIFNVAIWDE